jgi:LuxR family glucitol operon transcriptional activator
VVTIDGIGGIGKSTLALETAYSFIDQYDDLPKQECFRAIAWVSAKRTYLTASGVRERRQVFRTLEDLFASIVRILDYPPSTNTRADEQRAIVEDALREQRTLLIIDNLETVDDEHLQGFLRELPVPTKAIVTTADGRSNACMVASSCAISSGGSVCVRMASRRSAPIAASLRKFTRSR